MEENLKYYNASSVGSDEGGTGDYYGPIVVTACYVDKANLEELKKLQLNIIKKRSIKKVISDSYILKDIFFSLILVVIFLFIAAIIEAYVTPAITIAAFQ